MRFFTERLRNKADVGYTVCRRRACGMNEAMKPIQTIKAKAQAIGNFVDRAQSSLHLGGSLSRHKVAVATGQIESPIELDSLQTVGVTR